MDPVKRTTVYSIIYGSVPGVARVCHSQSLRLRGYDSYFERSVSDRHSQTSAEVVQRGANSTTAS